MAQDFRNEPAFKEFKDTFFANHWRVAGWRAATATLVGAIAVGAVCLYAGVGAITLGWFIGLTAVALPAAIYTGYKSLQGRVDQLAELYDLSAQRTAARVQEKIQSQQMQPSQAINKNWEQDMAARAQAAAAETQKSTGRQA